MRGGPVRFLDNTSADSGSSTQLLAIADVAKILKISVSGVRRLLAKRQIAFLKVGGSIRIHREDVTAYLARRRVEAVDQ